MAIYSFITDKDLDVGMKKYFRDQVIGTDTHILTISEGAAFSMIKAKLTGRYDLTKLFPEIKQYDNAKAYLKDSYCYQSDVIYKALANTTGQDPATNASVWQPNDPRDQLVVVYCVNITIYFFVEAINPRKINDDIINNFTNAMEWFDKVKTCEENPDWPLLDDGASEISWGSNRKLDHYW